MDQNIVIVFFIYQVLSDIGKKFGVEKSLVEAIYNIRERNFELDSGLPVVIAVFFGNLDLN